MSFLLLSYFKEFQGAITETAIKKYIKKRERKNLLIDLKDYFKSVADNKQKRIGKFSEKLKSSKANFHLDQFDARFNVPNINKLVLRK